MAASRSFPPLFLPSIRLRSLLDADRSFSPCKNLKATDFIGDERERSGRSSTGIDTAALILQEKMNPAGPNIAVGLFPAAG